jgi:hypothetical protein
VHIKSTRGLDADQRHTICFRHKAIEQGIIQMLPRLSQRTYDLMRRAIDAVDKDTADLITTLVASAFVDGGKEMLARNPEADNERE